MIQKSIPITEAGLKKLQDELKHLKAIARPEVLQAIVEARKHGDLSENAEYHAAKEKHAEIERKIASLESKISQAQVIDISCLSDSRICFGAKVTLKDEETEKSKIYQIVGEDEADISKGLLSCTSLLGKELIGKEKGASFELVTPGGEKSYFIEEVSYD